MPIFAQVKTLNAFYSMGGEKALDCVISWYGLKDMSWCMEFS